MPDVLMPEIRVIKDRCRNSNVRDATGLLRLAREHTARCTIGGSEATPRPVSVIRGSTIQECAKRIRLVTDELPDSDQALSGARAALDAAKAAAFLGFAYDHRSLERLGIDRLNRIANVPAGHERAVHGTSYGMTSGNCGRVEATVHESNC